MRMLKVITISVLGLGLAFFGFLQYQNLSGPKVIGVVDQKLHELPNTPNGVSSQTAQLDKKVEPIPFKETIDLTRNTIINAINEVPGAKVVEAEDNYIYAVFTSKLMKYRDDVEFLLDSESQLIQFRSQSRAGVGDHGVNRNRYNQFVELYNQQ